MYVQVTKSLREATLTLHSQASLVAHNNYLVGEQCVVDDIEVRIADVLDVCVVHIGTEIVREWFNFKAVRKRQSAQSNNEPQHALGESNANAHSDCGV